MTNLALFLYMLVVGATYMLLLTERRYSLKTTCIVAYTAVLLIGVLDIVLYTHLPIDLFSQLFALANHVPLFVLFLVLSKKRGWRAAFLVLTATLFCFSICHIAAVICFATGSLWAYAVTLALLGGVAAPVFIARFLRPRCLAGFADVEHGWGLMCLVIVFYYVINVYIIPTFATDSMMIAIVKLAISVLMAGFYAALLLLFSSAQREAEAREDARMLALQLSALDGRLSAVRAAEETIRIERHDMRHRLQTVAELVSRGKTSEALGVIDAAQTRLDEQQPIARWCRAPILDAVFSTYFDQAERRGIRVEARIALPDRLPIDESEFAVVCANAIENAINACASVPPDDRVIECKAIAKPSVMLEVRNPCVGPVRFGDEGLPAAANADHGTGAKSIAAFAKKHDATCTFTAEDGWFTFMIVL